MRRKILLAASFVVTAIGCQHEDGGGNTGPNPPEPPHANPPPTPTDTATATPTSDPTTTATTTGTSKPSIMNPPPPSVNDDPDVRIEKQPDGTCLRIVTAKCPPGVMCNPPPPQKVPCPAGK